MKTQEETVPITSEKCYFDGDQTNCTQTGSRAKASFYGRMIISMILIISIFQSLTARVRTVGDQKVRTAGVHLLCSTL